VTLLAGLDISLHRIDAAFVALDAEHEEKPLFRTVPIARVLGPERLRAAAEATREAFRFRYPYADVATVCIEQPFGRNSAMLHLYGAVCAAIPRHVHNIAELSAVEVRSTLNIKLKRGENIKARCISEALDWSHARGWWGALDEHEADALLTALAWRTRLELHAA
jgi:hypothetical protein